MLILIVENYGSELLRIMLRVSAVQQVQVCIGVEEREMCEM